MTAPTTFSTEVLCACGCGLGAPVPPSTDRKRGRFKGVPLKYRRGHQAKTRTRTPAEIRFWRLVEEAPADACWQWKACTSLSGHGMFNVSRGQVTGAHRFAYEDMVGPIPEGLDLDHLCRTPACVNPSHLDPVPRGVNVGRANAHRKNTKYKQKEKSS